MRNSGTIEKRGENKYRLKYMYKGKRHSKTVNCVEKQVEKELIRFILEIEDNEEKFQATKYNFSKFADEFLETYVRNNLKPRTYDYYKYLLDSRLKKWFGNKDINRIKRADIMDFLNNYSDELEKSTLRKYRNCLITMFNYAIKKDYLQINVAEKVDIPKGKKVNKKDNCYTHDQLKELLKELDTEQEERKIFVIIAMTTGLRREEICPLTIDDIDLDNNIISINKAMIESKEFGVLITDTKNSHSIREVDIPDFLSDTLKKYIETLPDKRLFKVLPDTMTSWFYKFIKRKQLPHITLHGLRHSYATYLINNNVDINTISTLLGHADIITTGKIYINKSRENAKQAVNLIKF